MVTCKGKYMYLQVRMCSWISTFGWDVSDYSGRYIHTCKSTVKCIQKCAFFQRINANFSPKRTTLRTYRRETEWPWDASLYSVSDIQSWTQCIISHCYGGANGGGSHPLLFLIYGDFKTAWDSSLYRISVSAVKDSWLDPKDKSPHQTYGVYSTHCS